MQAKNQKWIFLTVFFAFMSFSLNLRAQDDRFGPYEYPQAVAGERWFERYTNDRIAKEELSGFPVSNFAVTAAVAKDGEIFGRLLRNPGQLGAWLEDRGSIDVKIKSGKNAFSLSDFKKIDNNRQFPVSRISYKDLASSDIEIDLVTWAPIKAGDADITALPLVMTEMSFSNPSQESLEFTLVFGFKEFFGYYGAYYYETSDRQGPQDSAQGFAIDLPSSWNAEKMEQSVTIKLAPGETKTAKIALAFHDSLWTTARTHIYADALLEHAYAAWDDLYDVTAGFSKSLDYGVDEKVAEYMRWYVTSAFSLTKITYQGDVLTMGYNELNQRDSYWTSWLHLALFPELEKTMIRESGEYLTVQGKVPTTILPIIERQDDLDINAFYLLRMARYWRVHNDKDFVKEEWSNLVRAMDWLISRDLDKDGLPDFRSYWGDWKDVPGINGRQYAPFTSFLYLAALKEMASMAKELGEDDLKSRYKAAYDKGYKLVNKPVSKGGQWADTHYVQTFYDGRENNKVLLDQSIGVLFGVVPQDRAAKTLDKLTENNLTPYGMAETFPYYPADFGYNPGEYHNGAVWPWLAFMDIWARIREGRTDEAIKLINLVAKADLVESGDWAPNEHINSINGTNLGFFLQGWNAALFGVVHFGLAEQAQSPYPPLKK